MNITLPTTARLPDTREAIKDIKEATRDIREATRDIKEATRDIRDRAEVALTVLNVCIPLSKSRSTADFSFDRSRRRGGGKPRLPGRIWRQVTLLVCTWFPEPAP